MIRSNSLGFNTFIFIHENFYQNYFSCQIKYDLFANVKWWLVLTVLWKSSVTSESLQNGIFFSLNRLPSFKCHLIGKNPWNHNCFSVVLAICMCVCKICGSFWEAMDFFFSIIIVLVGGKDFTSCLFKWILYRYIMSI